MENQMNYSCECRTRNTDQETKKVGITKRHKEQINKLLSVFGKYAKAMSFLK